MNKVIEFKNLGSENVDLYVYGEIVEEKYPNWLTGQKNDIDIDLPEFREAINSLKEGDTLNIYVNSPGGSVFVASTMCSMLHRAKENGITIHAYVDGLAASAASFLIMEADDITMYKNSMLMVHKPMCLSFGNATELQKDIDTLNKLEESVMMPLYRNKAKCSDEEIKDMIEAETWLSADECAEVFDINISDVEKEMVACDKTILAKYKNTPKKLLEEEKVKEPESEFTQAYFNAFEERIKKLKERKNA